MSLKKDIKLKQGRLESEQANLIEQMEAQKLAASARSGNLSDYRNLESLAKQASLVQPIAKALLRDVNLYYGLEFKQLTYPRVVDRISKTDPGFSIEELLQIIKNEPNLREAAINSVADKNRKSSVAFLVKTLESEQDLRVISRIIRAISQITSNEFEPLDMAAVNAWWDLNKSNVEYEGHFAAYIDAVEDDSLV